ncbi:zinc ribbon domain-containing protein [Sulfolobus tengchongensis]|uniref:Zinc ribbon domain-containing protein n=1 Tax=Sulfolobus tengchongensis TaxID=207809 RepID=A0AAX4L218_9CREN
MNKYLKIAIPAIAILAIVAISIPTISALINSSSKVTVISASTAESIFGGTWQVLQNETYLKVYPTENITIYYANGTNVTVQYPHQIKSLNHEVLTGNINGTHVIMIINLAQFTSNVSRYVFPDMFIDHHFVGDRHDFALIYNSTTYDGYYVIYFASTVPRPHTIMVAYKGSTLIEISLNGYMASISQMEQILNNI